MLPAHGRAHTQDCTLQKTAGACIGHAGGCDSSFGLKQLTDEIQPGEGQGLAAVHSTIMHVHCGAHRELLCVAAEG